MNISFSSSSKKINLSESANIEFFKYAYIMKVNFTNLRKVFIDSRNDNLVNFLVESILYNSKHHLYSDHVLSTFYIKY